MTEDNDGKDPTEPKKDRLETARTFTDTIRARCEDPGVRAALRSGIGRHPDQARRMHRVMVSLLPDGVLDSVSRQRPYYAVAAMIADTYAWNGPPGTANNGDADQERPTDTPTAEQPTPRKTLPRRRSLGLAYAQAVTSGGEGGIRENSAARHLDRLVRQNRDGLDDHLPRHVRRIARVLDHTEHRIDFAALLLDLRDWPWRNQEIGRRWLQDFYHARHIAQNDDPDNNDGDQHN